MQKFMLSCLALGSLINCLQADMVYAAVSGLPTDFLPSPSGNVLHNARPPHLQNGQLVRSPRSLYGPPVHGWHGPPVASQSIGFGHISKQELITLLEAAKEVSGRPAPGPEAEPEPEARPEAAPAAGPPAGVPLTVSLPAFVPIQLSAMYTAPKPAAAPEAPAPAGGGALDEEEGDGEEEDEDEEEEEEDEVEVEPEPESVAPLQPYHPIYHQWSSRGVFNRPIAPYVSPSSKTSPVRGKSSRTKSKSKAHKSKSKKSKSKTGSKKRKSNLPYASSVQNIQALPPPPFLARPPGPLKLVPSDQLLSNWK